MHVPFLFTKPSRYARFEALSQVGRTGHKRLLKSKVAIVGLGSLGSVSTQALARLGIGSMTLIDRDIVEEDNLYSQFLYTEKDINQPKAEMAKKRIMQINHEIKVSAHTVDLTSENIDATLGKKDLILDCTDNLETRFLINDYCRKHKIPWVYASAVADTGMVASFTHEKNKPCFRCIFDHKKSEMSCTTHGVMSTLVLLIGALQAQQACTILLGKPAESTLIRAQMSSPTLEKMSLTQQKNCPLCSQKKFMFLEEKHTTDPVKLCGASCFQITEKKKDMKKLKERLERLGKVEDYGSCMRFKELTIFPDGRVLVKTESIDEARALYHKYIGP
jgi:adenylyltransferase/sulfurtransferase